MTARRTALVIVAVLAVATRAAAADPVAVPPVDLHIHSDSHLITDGGNDLRLPPGYFQDEPTHDKLDQSLKGLQDDKTRLTAENGSLKAAVSTWQPGWYVVLGAVVTGVAAGWYLHDKL